MSSTIPDVYVVDFNETLVCKRNRPRPGARAFVRSLAETGVPVIIWSCSKWKNLKRLWDSSMAEEDVVVFFLHQDNCSGTFPFFKKNMRTMFGPDTRIVVYENTPDKIIPNDHTIIYHVPTWTGDMTDRFLLQCVFKTEVNK